MGLSFSEAGAGLHNSAAAVAQAIAGAAHFALNAPGRAAAATENAGSDFVHGLMTGHAIAQAAAAPPPAKAASKPAGPKAPVYTQAFLNAQPNFVQQSGGQPAAAAIKAQPGGPAAATATPQSPLLDAMNQLVAARGGPGNVVLGDLPGIGELATKMMPQKGMTQLDANTLANHQQYAAMATAIAKQQIAAAVASGDPIAIRQAQANALSAFRPLVGTPNPLGDVNNAIPQP